MSNLAAQKIPRLRTIKAAMAEVRKLDPETAVTEWYIRQLCKSNRIVYYASGSKALVSLDSLLDHLGYKEE